MEGKPNQNRGEELDLNIETPIQSSETVVIGNSSLHLKFGENKMEADTIDVGKQQCYFDVSENSNIEVISKRLEDNLKTQNDLIQQLQLQLSECQVYNLVSVKALKEHLQEQNKSTIELNLIKIKNEEKQAKEQRQKYLLEQNYQTKIRSVQQEYENKMTNLQKTLNNRKQHLQNLHERNKVFGEQMRKLQDKLQQTLISQTKERENFKEQSLIYQQEIEQLNFHIRNLNNQILQLRIRQSEKNNKNSK